MAKKRTCFVISPIGPDDSDIRARANDFLELLVEPALQKFDFEVIRADKIQQPTAITGDIIRLVQESDLCVIDLTDTNPNVFYECGRRHETGKPFIQMIEKGSLDKLPFDVAGIRTISYDLASSRTSLKSVQELQSYIQGFIDSGFKAGGSGESLLSIAQGIDRLERKVNILLQAKSEMLISSPTNINSSIEDLVMAPQEAYRKAIGAGDLTRAFSAAQRFGPARDKLEYMAMMGLLASSGFELAYDALDGLFQVEISATKMDETVGQAIQLFAATMRRYFEGRGDLSAPIDNLKGIVDKVEGMEGETNSILAYLYNQMGMNCWLREDNQGCIEHTLRASQLEPAEAAYVYNLALAYEKEGDEPHLIAALRSLKEMGTDEDHLEILRRHGF